MLDLYDRWGGFIPIVGGVYAMLLANCVLPRKTKSPEKIEQWRRKYGTMMNIVGPIIILTGILDLFGVVGFRPAHPKNVDLANTKGVTMHRVQAGTPDTDGWYTAVSTNGGFSVRLPVPFNDMSFDAPDDAGHTTKNYVIGTKSAEGLKFSVLEHVRGAGDANVSPHEFIKKLGNSLVGTPQFSTVDGLEAVEIRTADGSSGLYQRYVNAPDRIILMTLEYPKSQEAVASGIVDAFLMSLKIAPHGK